MQRILLLTILLAICPNLFANETDANIVGDVQSGGKHIPFANVYVKGTTIGTVTDGTGHYQLVHLPEGTYTVVASALGYKSESKEIILAHGKTEEIKFSLTEDVLGLDEVVITGDRNAQIRTEAPVIVSTISPELFSTTNSVTLSEGLNFAPGLRSENNCSNCGFTQVRMNGMEGPYSQILINSRPIFSGLAGVYGLELIPSSMIEKVEIVRGGGSALYGGNAIAGTINLILKDPLINSYEIGTNSSLTGVGMSGTGGTAWDHSINFSSSVVSDDAKTGLTVYGFVRDKEPFDGNADTYSETSMMNNTTVGGRLFHKFGARSKVSVDFFRIEEERRGGNKFEKLPHEVEVAEMANHKISTGAVTYERFFREYDVFSVFASAQAVDRGTYYGAGFSPADYGQTDDLTYNTGVQYKALLGKATFTSGVDYTSGNLVDQKLGYTTTDDGTGEEIQLPNRTIADQESNTLGVFSQLDFKWDRLKLSTGGRLDSYEIVDHEGDHANNAGVVFTPRLNVLYDIFESLQGRVSYSQGYRAPQIFDEDLHIETSEAFKVLHENDPDLKVERSHSYMGSLDFNKTFGKVATGFLVEGFYTQLIDPFSSERIDGTGENEGIVTKRRINADGTATVTGVNTELNLIPAKDLTITSGFTYQLSYYDEPQDFDEKNFVRTPNEYGFVVVDWDFMKNLCFSVSGNYTGEMLVPYYGVSGEEMRTSDRFYDLGTKLEYTVPLNKGSLIFTAGVKNILNAYQNDLEVGEDRDPGYVYGPGAPRTIYFGVKLGNLL